MKVTTNHQQACWEAWVNCEHLLAGWPPSKMRLSYRRIVNECAQICKGTLQALVSNSNSFYKMALLCIGICEECAEICDSQQDASFKKCGEACRKCSNSFASLALASMYN